MIKDPEGLSLQLEILDYKKNYQCTRGEVLSTWNRLLKITNQQQLGPVFASVSEKDILDHL